MKKNVTKKLLMKWLILFFIGNAFLLFLIGLNYLSTKPWKSAFELSLKTTLILKTFFVMSYIGQLAFIAFLPAIILLPLVLVFPRWRWIAAFAILSATCIALWITVDTIIYNLYRFHFNTTLFNLTLEGLTQNVFALSFFEIFLIIVFFTLILLIEWGYAYWLWRYVQKKPYIKTRWTVGGFTLCLYVSYTSFLISPEPVDRFLLDAAKFLPLYYNILGSLTFQSTGSIAISRFNERETVRPDHAVQKLAYPLKPLVCNQPATPKNIVIIGVDTWRFDMVDKTIMPNVTQFAQQAWQFTNHYSGGNSTGPGIFSLFYGIPATYWTAMIEQHRPPIIFTELKKQGYQIGIFNSSNLIAPPIYRNVFQSIKNLNVDKQPGSSPNKRDKMTTDNFKNFVRENAKQPFFSFIFYDSAHSYCTTDVKDQPFLPIAPECLRFSLSKNVDVTKYFNRYKNALYFIDKQIKTVIETLRAENLLNETIIIVTGDHGEEFDDNGLGYWGHTGNFTRYQVQTPLIVYMPGQSPQVFTHRTSHFDIIPTLLQQVLNCENPISDYSVGKLLLNQELRSYLLVGSYVDFSIIEPDRITTVFPTGYFSVENTNGQNMSDKALNTKVIKQAFHEMRQFYQT